MPRRTKQSNVSFIALKEWAIDLTFQLSNLFGQRRLADVKSLRSTSVVQFCCKRHRRTLQANIDC